MKVYKLFRFKSFFAKDFLKYYPGTSTFILSMLSLAPFIHMGLDVTDPGFHLVNQLMVGRIGINYIIEQPYWWFSDVIGWCWLSITESLHMGLIGARIGGIVIFSASAAIASSLVSRFLFTHWLIPLSALCVAPFYSSFLSLISYDSVPAFLGLITIFVYLEGLQNEQKLEKYLLFSLAGVICFFVLLSRLPALSILFLPVYFCIVSVCVNKQSLNNTITAAGIFYIVLFTLILSFFLYIYWSGLLSKIQANQPLDTHYTSNYIFSVISSQWSLLKVWVLWFLIPSTIFVGLLLFRPSKIFNVLVSLFSFFTLASYFIIFLQNKLPDLFVGTLNFIFMLWLLILATCFVILNLRNKTIAVNQELKYKILSIVGIAIVLPIIVSAGSSAGIAKLQFGSYLIPPALIGILTLIFQNKNQMPVYGFKVGLVFLAIFISMNHLYFKGVFRDNPNRQLLTNTLNIPRLTGVYTTKERAKSVEQLYIALNSIAKEGGKLVLVYREAPLIYYLINALPFQNWVWPDLLSLDQIKIGSSALCNQDLRPFFVIRALEPTGNPLWGDKSKTESFAPPWQVEKYEAIDKAVLDCGYISVWKNVDFEILMMPHFK